MLTDWSEFFVAAAGASAALAGLIIVAISVSVDEMIAIAGMTSRAASAVSLLVLVAVVSLAGLIPHQPPALFGVVTAAAGALALVIGVTSLVRLLRSGTGTGAALVKGLGGVVPAACVVGGGAAVAAGLEAGLAWLAAGVLLAFAVSVLDAWVVLVEIRR